jgi:nicotinamidase-related amidase
MVKQMKPALMIIDLQKAFCRGESQKSMEVACEYINAILSVFREKDLPIVWVQHIDKEEGVVPGAEGFEFIDQLKPEEGEYHIHKEYGNSFNKTSCHEILKEHDVDTVVITGYCAEHCVLSTYRGALDVDLTPVILKNAVASGNKENLRFVLDISNMISYDILKKILTD